MLRRLVVCLLLLWLPLQGMAALTMPFCRHGQEPGAAAATEHAAQLHTAHVHAGHRHDPGPPAQPGAEQPPAADHLACNECGACHLACAPAVPSHAAEGLAPLPGTPRLGPPPCAPPAVVLEQPNPPPLTRG
jgi:hypothetical protein